MSKISCGIDFGTTNSAISIVKMGQSPELVPFLNGKNTMPTAIFYPAERGAYPIFGDAAVKAYIDGERGRFMRSMKRVLGSNLMSTGTRINDTMMRFEHILSQFVGNLKKQAEVYAGAPIDSVIMGRPVHFRDGDLVGDQRAENELRRVAQLVGFRNIEFQFEPIAAAYAHEVKLQREQLACVVDIGGGTSDFTIIKIGPKLKNKLDRSDDILASTGVRIGGNDFDKDLCLKCFMPEFGFGTLGGGKSKYDKILPLATMPYHTLAEWSSVNSMYVPKEINFAKKMLYNAQEPEKVKRLIELLEKESGHTLLTAVEQTKIQLTDREQLDIVLNFISDAPKIKATKNEFEQSMKHDIVAISKSVNECIVQAQISPKDIQMVILTGGSTEIPAIQKKMIDHFPNAELSQENKLSSVGIGLAYDSRRRFHEDNENIVSLNKIINVGRQ